MTEENRRILELGCGTNKIYANSVGVDKNPMSDADVAWDLDEFPYPFEDNSFDLVMCYHIMEHVADFVRCIEETHRILRPYGILRVESPHFSSVGSFTDPTHKRFLTASTFDYFIDGTRFVSYKYTQVRFRMVRRHLTFMKDRWMLPFVQRWLNAHIELYERHWAFILPGNVISYELEAVKG